MSIQIIEQDITLVENGIIGHGVNCQGKMNSGVAKALRQKYPKIFHSYEALCNIPNKALLLGGTDLVEVSPGELIIANMFTQEYYGKDGKRYANLKSIEECIATLFMTAIGRNIKDVFLPKIGCGLGGLDWEDEVFPVIKQELDGFDQSLLHVWICIK